MGLVSFPVNRFFRELSGFRRVELETRTEIATNDLPLLRGFRPLLRYRSGGRFEEPNRRPPVVVVI